MQEKVTVVGAGLAGCRSCTKVRFVPGRLWRYVTLEWEIFANIFRLFSGA